MNDKQLLELAAKAAGIQLWWRGGRAICNATGYWNPLTNDGDALRLAVKFRMLVEIDHYGAMANGFSVLFAVGFAFNMTDEQKMAATRRAIVRAAAAIGESMP